MEHKFPAKVDGVSKEEEEAEEREGERVAIVGDTLQSVCERLLIRFQWVSFLSFPVLVTVFFSLLRVVQEVSTNLWPVLVNEAALPVSRGLGWSRATLGGLSLKGFVVAPNI